MKADSGRQGQLIRNLDVRQEFEKIMKDPNLIGFWKNYIRGRLIGSLISQFERNTTEDDILSRLKMKIYDRGMEWDKNVYKTFKHFMYGKIQNIIRNKEKCLARRYEKYLMEEESREGGYIASPTIHTEMDKAKVNINLDRIDEGLLEGEDKYAYHNDKPKTGIDKEKFHEDVYAILKSVKDTDCLVIFAGLMDGKDCKMIKREFGMTDMQYKNSYKKLKRKLRKQLPPEYKEMFKE